MAFASELVRMTIKAVVILFFAIAGVFLGKQLRDKHKN